MPRSGSIGVIAGQVEECLPELSPEARAEIETWLNALMSIRNMGRKGATEVVGKLLVYQSSPHCKLCGAPIEDAKKRICQVCFITEI